MRTTTRSAIVLATGATLLLGACSSDKQTAPPTSTIPSSTTSTAASTTSTSVPPSTTGTVPVDGVSIAVWPLASSSTRFADPRAAARSFATGLLHMVAPVVGAFRQGDQRSGEVDVRKKATGPVTTVLVRKLGTGSWWVIGSTTPNIRITEPAALATISSPVRLRGTSTAFEGTINIAIRDDTPGAPLAETFTNGGANGTMGPFDTTVPFRRPATPSGAVVIYTISSEDGHVAEGTVIRVHFSGA